MGRLAAGIKPFALGVGSTFIALCASNYFFHQILAADLFASRLPDSVRPVSGLGPLYPGIIYLGLAASMALAAFSTPDPVLRRRYALISGPILGVISFGTWNLINYGMIPDWPLSIVLIDTAWHGVCGLLCGGVLAAAASRP